MVGVDLRERLELVLDRDWEEYRLIAEEEELREDEDLILVVDRLGVE